MNLLIKISGFFYEYMNKNSLILIPLLVAALTIYFFGIYDFYNVSLVVNIYD